ncbi:MAG: DUF349 domain-containing protein [Paludibacter sp.]|nr:DUF349 domain-containing protein [Paludibacter sp.]
MPVVDEEIVSSTESPKELVVVTESVAEKTEPAEILSENDAAELEPAEVKDEKSPDLNVLSRVELLNVLKELLSKKIDDIKEEVEHIKQLFYKKLKTEMEEQKKLFVENGGEEADFKPVKDGLDEELKSLINDYKSKKASLSAKIEAEKEQNLLEKQHILERMKTLVESNDDVSSHINEFRELQKKWKSIGLVPQAHVNELWKSYSAFQETFWDLIKINNELREYDFKKNLEVKSALCEAAERLAEEDDVIEAFRQLQKLHEDWHETGPVAREIREELWTRFKTASSAINKRHQGHFDEVRKLEEDNLTAKTALCEKLEAFEYSTLNSYKAWDEATKTIIAWQEEWRALGFAPRKMNHKIFDRYRAACDAFFSAKAEFYKASKNVLNENLDKKKALCEKAEALKDSTEWKETTDKLIQLQKEWKTIGPVAKKYSDEIWKRFISACDYFFDQKQKNTSGQKSAETENLVKKKAIIASVNELDTVTDKTPAEILATLREYIAAWNEVGHVPFKEKDKIYKEYRSAVDKMFEKLNVDANQRRLDTFKSNLKDMSTKGENKLYREREKLMRAYEHLKSEIATYENNIGFLTTSNKKGNGLINEMMRKIEALKDEAKLIEQKITLIEESM